MRAKKLRQREKIALSIVLEILLEKYNVCLGAYTWCPAPGLLCFAKEDIMTSDQSLKPNLILFIVNLFI